MSNLLAHMAAIDFGAAGTKAAFRSGLDDDISVVRFGAAREFPTVVYESSKSRLWAGARALNMGGQNWRRLHRSLKQEVHRPGDVALSRRRLR
jgi:hypothetical protein